MHSAGTETKLLKHTHLLIVINILTSSHVVGFVAGGDAGTATGLEPVDFVASCFICASLNVLSIASVLH